MSHAPDTKRFISWHQIKKYLRHCLRAHRFYLRGCLVLRWANTLAFALHSFVSATPIQGAPSLTWTQGFRTWLIWSCPQWTVGLTFTPLTIVGSNYSGLSENRLPQIRSWITCSLLRVRFKGYNYPILPQFSSWLRLLFPVHGLWWSQ